MTTGPAELLILRWLTCRDHAPAPAIGTACSMAPAEVRTRLVSLESQRRVASRSDKQGKQSQRVYYVTAEGRRAAGLLDNAESAAVHRDVPERAS